LADVTQIHHTFHAYTLILRVNRKTRGVGEPLIGVDDEVVWAAVADLGHEGPLKAGGEAGPATPAETGRLDLVDDPVAAEAQEVLGAVPVTLRKNEKVSTS
jgi:hypothetical protein